jgi:hypothetical protein
MSFYLRVFCRSARVPTRRELAERIVDGVHFDDSPRFNPEFDSPELRSPAWQRLDVFYDPARRPVQIYRNGVGDELLTAEATRAAEAVTGAGGPPEVAEWLRQSVQIFAIEADPASLTDAAWEMVDALEAYLARSLDGLIYVAGEAAYDAAFKKLVSLGL